MEKNYTLRDRLHYLISQIGGISVTAQGFFFSCKDFPDEISASTKNELSKALGDIDDSYKNVVSSLNSISRVLDKTITSKDWDAVKGTIENDVKNVYGSIITIKKMAGKISAANLKNDILNIAENIGSLHEKCKAICRLIDDFKDLLLSKGIYDNAYNDNGEIRRTKILR
jgi:Mg2+ and Co2+ transporter CorA